MQLLQRVQLVYDVRVAGFCLVVATLVVDVGVAEETSESLWLAELLLRL